MNSGAGFTPGVCPSAEADALGAALRWTTTTKRSGLPMTVRAISNNSIVRHDERTVLANVAKLASSG